MLRVLYSALEIKFFTVHLLTILVFFYAIPIWAEPLYIPVVEGSWEENYDEPRPVSGYLYMGTIIGNEKMSVDPDLLIVHLPKTNSSMLCVEIMSRDARYYARANYVISGLSTGIYRIELPTIFSNTLKNYKADEISVLAELKDGCESPDMISFIPVSWGLPNNSNLITIQLNVSGAASKLIIPDRTDNGSKENVKCRIIDSGVKNTSFDTLCTFKTNDLSSLCEISLRRRRLGDILRPKKLRIFCGE
jgi:hypothetical protein